MKGREHGPSGQAEGKPSLRPDGLEENRPPGLAFQLFLQMSRPKCTEVKRQPRPHTPGAGRWLGGRGCDSRAPSSAPAWPSFPAHQGEQSVVLNPGTAEGAGSVRPQGVELRAGVVLKPPWPQVPRPQSCLYSRSTGPAQAGVVPRPADLGVGVRARVKCTGFPSTPKVLGEPGSPHRLTAAPRGEGRRPATWPERQARQPQSSGHRGSGRSQPQPV